jgi:putative phage-type endonuclease
MKIVKLTQGSPEWLAHRAKHFNASDAPAMLGCSPHKSRRQLLAELATGITPEVDAGTQRRFNLGHRLEALARPLAEEILGEPLYPATGVEGRYSASFDGLTLGGEIIFEHKALNDELRGAFAIDEPLPRHYLVQVEHQLLVSGADRCLFMASNWDAAGNLIEHHTRDIVSDPVLREQIVAGWEQFARDLEAFTPAEPAPAAAVGTAPETLPALRIEVEGTVISSNLQAFRETAITAIRNVRRELTTDQDFADAELSVKWCREVETRLEAAKAQALSQTASIDELFRTIDDVAAEARRVRLDLEKLVKARKDEIRIAIVTDAQRALEKHLATLSADVEPFTVSGVVADFAGAIKGKRSIEAMHDAVDAALAEAKIRADAAARVVRTNVAVLNEFAAFTVSPSLFPDAGRLVGMEPAAFREIVSGRIAKHEAAVAEQVQRAAGDAAREAAERARVQEEKRAAPRRAPVIEPATGAVLSEGDPAPERPSRAADAGDEPATLNLGAISKRIGVVMPLDFIVNQLRIQPAGNGPKRSVLFTESQFLDICEAFEGHLQAVRIMHEQMEVADVR